MAVIEFRTLKPLRAFDGSMMPIGTVLGSDVVGKWNNVAAHLEQKYIAMLIDGVPLDQAMAASAMRHVRTPMVVPEDPSSVSPKSEHEPDPTAPMPPKRGKKG